MDVRTMASAVRGALETVGATVAYESPQREAQLPLIAWRESENRVYAQADGQEHLTGLEYVVNVWARGPEACAGLADGVDEAMNALGLRRESSVVAYDGEAGAYRRAMRYACLIDGRGNVYH